MAKPIKWVNGQLELFNDDDYNELLTNINLEVGVDVQAYSPILDQISTPTETGYVKLTNGSTVVDIVQGDTSSTPDTLVERDALGQIATTAVDMGNGVYGKMFWNSDDGTVDVTLLDGSVLQLGQEEHIRAKNISGQTISNGQLVVLTGSQGNTPTVELAVSDASAISGKTIGMATTDIHNNNVGYITIRGLVRFLNTSAYTEGTVLYLSTTPGAFTNVRPTAPNHEVVVGIVTRQHATNGTVYLRIINSFNLGELHNVRTDTVVDKDILKYNGVIWSPGRVSYTELSNIPLTFTPSAHTHTTADITNLSSYTGFDARYYTETESDGRFAPLVHTHTTADITNLSSYTGLDSRYYTESEVNTLLLDKEDVGVAASIISAHELALDPHPQYMTETEGDGRYRRLNVEISYTELSNIPLTFTPSAHTHTTADITNLSSYTGFDARYLTESEADARFAGISHNHTTADITNLSSYTGFDARYYTESEADARFAGISHNHTTADVTDLASYTGFTNYYTKTRTDGKYIPLTEKGAANGVATLDANGKLPTSQLPPLAVSDTFVVASEAAMLALTAQRGDIAVRTDINQTFILSAEPATSLANWQQLLSPSTGVTSVFGRTGAVSAQYGDYSFSLLSGTPTTLSGYGITDAAPLSHVGSSGASHGTVTTSVAGFMSAADKVKLDGISAGAKSDHGALSGLADDDHTQYYNSTRLGAYTGFDSRYYTETETNTLLSAKENVGVAASLLSTHTSASDPHPQYLTQTEGDGRYRRILDSIDWSDIVNTPSTYTPSAHTHTTADITNLSIYTGFDARYYTELEADGRFAPISHTHSTADITNLSSYTGFDTRYYTETESDARFSLIGHTHTTSDITDITQAGIDFITAPDVAAQISLLGLGTAAFYDTGTTGTSVPLLTGYNYWTNNQVIKKTIPSIELHSASSTKRYAIDANISDSVDGGFRVKWWNGSSYNNILTVTQNGIGNTPIGIVNSSSGAFTDLTVYDSTEFYSAAILRSVEFGGYTGSLQFENSTGTVNRRISVKDSSNDITLFSSSGAAVTSFRDSGDISAAGKIESSKGIGVNQTYANPSFSTGPVIIYKSNGDFQSIEYTGSTNSQIELYSDDATRGNFCLSIYNSTAATRSFNIVDHNTGARLASLVAVTAGNTRVINVVSNGSVCILSGNFLFTGDQRG